MLLESDELLPDLLGLVLKEWVTSLPEGSSACAATDAQAFLRHKGVSVKDLQKKFGHDLHACHRKAKELGLHEVFKEQPDDSDAMRMLVGLNEQQGLRYIKTGMKHFPLWSIVEPLAVRLHQAVAPLVGFKSFDKSYQGYLVAKPSAATLTAAK